MNPKQESKTATTRLHARLFIMSFMTTKDKEKILKAARQKWCQIMYTEWQWWISHFKPQRPEVTHFSRLKGKKHQLWILCSVKLPSGIKGKQTFSGEGTKRISYLVGLFLTIWLEEVLWTEVQMMNLEHQEREQWKEWQTLLFLTNIINKKWLMIETKIIPTIQYSRQWYFKVRKIKGPQWRCHFHTSDQVVKCWYQQIMTNHTHT